MQWIPQKPPRRRVTLLAWAIAGVPIAFFVVGLVVLLWQLLGPGVFGS